jgi:dTDP-4-dehydrorhamnose 3,5-epimerase
MEVIALDLPDVKLLRLMPHRDQRGAFTETYAAPRFAEAGLPTEWAQDNEVHTVVAGTVRGLHYQIAPHAQAKLVRVVSGRIFDVAVDLRRDAPTFGRHVAVTLNAERFEALLIPEGFAHGYCTLSLDTIVQYKVSRPYAPAAERSLLWCDPALGVTWPVGPDTALVSDKDKAAAPLGALQDLF